MKKSVLDRVTMGFRCAMNWEEMAGSGRDRFCRKGQKSVTNLSQLTREEADAFVRVQGPRGEACIRFLRDVEGRWATQGCGAPAVVGKKMARTLTVAAAAAGSLTRAACSHKAPVEVLGGIACPTLEK